ncbi:MAG: DUF2752 domain-containing protein [Clostridia bacterium]|nr:DUF2752 domain-containing protein [Clostridia bacterium]
MKKRKIRRKYIFRLLYIFVPLLSAAFGYILLHRLLKEAFPNLFLCAFYEIFGIACMGCGGTRSLRALLRFDIFSSFFYYPAILIASILLLTLLFFYLLTILTGEEKIAKRFPLYIFYFLPLCIFLTFLTRLILFLCGIPPFS